MFEKGTLPENHPRHPLMLTVDVDRSEGAINEKLEGRRKVFVGLVFARRRNALLKLLDRDLAVLQWKQARDIQKCPLPRCATPFSTCEGGGPLAGQMVRRKPDLFLNPTPRDTFGCIHIETAT